MPKRSRNPNNIWNEERNKFLTEQFNATSASDKKLAAMVNEKFEGCDFKPANIAAQRSNLHLKRSNITTARRSSKTLPSKKERVASSSLDLVFLSSIKEGDYVYIPRDGVSLCLGKQTIGADSFAAGEYIIFSSSEKKGAARKIPENKLADAHIRQIMTAEQAKEVVAILKSPAKNPGPWMRARVDLNNKMGSPDFRDIAEIIRDTLVKKAESGSEVAYSYQMMGKQALALLAKEYAWALKMGVSEAMTVLETAALAPKRQKQEPAAAIA